MEKALIKTKEKELNIFQKIRLKIFEKSMNKSNFDFQKYKDAPIYIKRDDSIINALIRNISVINATEREKFYLEIPQDILIEILKEKDWILDELSIETQMDFARIEPSIVKMKTNQINILRKALEVKKYDFWKMYPESQEIILEDMKKDGSLNAELPNIIKYLKDKNKDNFIAKQPDLLSNLNIEEQLKYVYRDRKYLKYVSEDEQLNFIQKNEEYIPFASDKISEELIKIDIGNLAKTNAEFQCKIVQRYPKAYESISEQVKKEIWTNPNNKESIKTALGLIGADGNFSKNIIANYFEILSKSDYDDNSYNEGSVLEKELINFLNNCGAVDTREFFEKSKILSSHSTLLDRYTTLHGGIGAEPIIAGREKYSAFQRRVVRKLDKAQMKELINLDVNYILPYLGTDDSSKTAKKWELTDEGKNNSKIKCKELLNEIYGEELTNQLEECVEKIYSLDMQEQIYNNLKYGEDVMQK